MSMDDSLNKDSQKNNTPDNLSPNGDRSYDHIRKANHAFPSDRAFSADPTFPQDRADLTRQAGIMFRRADGMLRRFMERKVEHTGVYPTQHRLLMELGRNPGVSQVELAEKFDVSAAAITVSLKKLEKGGYISRLVNREDNRSNQVSITEKGSEVIDYSIEMFREADRRLFNGFTDQDVERFLEYMKRVYTNLSSETAETENVVRKESGKT